jgi:hypothetical protein
VRHERWGRVRWVVSLDGANRSRLGFPSIRTWDRSPDDVWREVDWTPFAHRDYVLNAGQVAIGPVLPPPEAGSDRRGDVPLPGVRGGAGSGRDMAAERGSDVSHRVWQDYGTDGTRTWPRWWCSCGAHGQGWPANHGDSR